ncbi:MAG: DUF6046 domain-containing protein [Bacteroidales bacterium]|jgi:hypothetical protein|nr:DUF6046 domain-containing protein [Bacteroidales bacterium]
MNTPADIRQQVIQGDRNRALWVGSVISDIFGISSPVYLPWGEDRSLLPGGYGTGEDPVAENASEPTSMFGTPILGAVTFEGGTYSTYDRMSGRLIQGRYNDYTLPFSCICEFSRESHVITTGVLGNTGTVKELFGLGDWSISIRGIAVNGADRGKTSAHEQIKMLVKWQDINCAINVGGEVFESKSIYSIAIKSLDIQPIVAKYNVIPFQISAVSDEPLELTL